MSGVTELLFRWRAGDRTIFGDLANLVYPELKRIAAARLKCESPAHILQPTALVNEAWIKFSQLDGVPFESRVHFLSFCARLMRQILVDHARKRREVDSLSPPIVLIDSDTLLIDRALTQLASLHERQSLVVEMRYFGGMTNDEIAQMLDVSAITVKRDWIAARAWLYGHLK